MDLTALKAQLDTLERSSNNPKSTGAIVKVPKKKKKVKKCIVLIFENPC